jgi:hypothetical protein
MKANIYIFNSDSLEIKRNQLNIDSQLHKNDSEKFIKAANAQQNHYNNIKAEAISQTNNQAQQAVKKNNTNITYNNTDSLPKSGNYNISEHYNLKLQNKIQPFYKNIFKNPVQSDLSLNPNVELYNSQNTTLQNAGDEYFKYLKVSNYKNLNFSSDWFLISSIISLFILGLSRYYFSKYFKQFSKSVLNFNLLSKLHSDKNVLFKRFLQILKVVFSINAGIFITLIIKHYFKIDNFNALILFILLMFVIPIFYSIKTFINIRIAKIFDISEIISEYTFIYNFYNKLLGIILLPLIILMLYFKEIPYNYYIYAGLVLFLTIILIKFLWGVQIIFRKGGSLFYMILYLCSLEIIPFLLLYKVVQISLKV